MKPVELDLDAIPKRPRKRAEPKPSPPRKAAWWRRIARSLRIDGPQTEAALIKNLGIHPDTVHFAMRYWLKRGIVERVGRRWKLTERHANYGKLGPRKAPKPGSPKPTAWDRLAEDD